jgi:hypothetical protein
VVAFVWLGVGFGRRRACAGCGRGGTARIGGDGLACLVCEARRVPGGEAQHFRVESGGGSLPPLGHRLDAASADRDDRDTGQGGQGGHLRGITGWADFSRDLAAHPLGGWSGSAQRSHTDLVDPFGRRRAVEVRLVPRGEALAQTVAERAVELVVSLLDINALLDEVDLNALLDEVDLNALLDQVDIERVLSRVDLDRVLEQVDLNSIVARIDVDALVERTDLGAMIAKSSSGVASEALDAVRSHVVELDEFIARWIGRLRRRPYTGPPGPPEPPGALRGRAGA